MALPGATAEAKILCVHQRTHKTQQEEHRMQWRCVCVHVRACVQRMCVCVCVCRGGDNASMCYWLHQGVKVKLLPSVWKHNVNKETVLTVLLSLRWSCTGACFIWARVDKYWLLLGRAVNIQLYSKHL